MGSSSNRLFKLAQIKFLDVSPNHPDRMIGRHQRLQIDCPKLDLIAYRFPHPWLSRIGHPLVFLYRKIGKKFVARHRCTSRTVQQQESLPACKLNPNRAQRFTASQDEGLALGDDIVRLDALDAGLGHVGPGFCERALGVDAAAGVLDDIGFKAGLARVERAPRHAEVGGEAGEEYPLYLAGYQISGESRRGLAVSLGEGRIAVDVLVKTLADDEPGMRNRKILRQRRAVGAL